MFDIETNKAIALRLVEVFNGRRLDLLEEVLHPEFRGRGLSAFPPDSPEVGPGARRKFYEMFYQAIPDARAEVLDVAAEGDNIRNASRNPASNDFHISTSEGSLAIEQS